MKPKTKLSLLLKLAIAKKAVLALTLLIISIGAGFSWRHYEAVTTWAATYMLTAEYALVRSLLQFVIHSDIEQLKLIARLSGIYGALIAIAAVGLWFGATWAYGLFLGLVGILLPVEIFELIHNASLSTAALFMVNLGIFGFLLKEWPEIRHSQLDDA
ncbi:hypothetical protein DO97_11400 [Neosynechococcus sphagnicola sy1]|uniref:Uncharacterized protein n=1 Tax=Neosynechococcus sphagnicola sy1 TaxID=1497020 RepID=A0A098TK66_9CYAN|nr:DUF2127 domain-containing protein [Neosynechococcus sphagnicola]KGF72232.1 hypothetical protein DO97_11400 [Neosynechococcus sphagnicola sy1]